MTSRGKLFMTSRFAALLTVADLSLAAKTLLRRSFVALAGAVFLLAMGVPARAATSVLISECGGCRFAGTSGLNAAGAHRWENVHPARAELAMRWVAGLPGPGSVWR
jgi:hypothetical protein